MKNTSTLLLCAALLFASTPATAQDAGVAPDASATTADASRAPTAEDPLSKEALDTLRHRLHRLREAVSEAADLDVPLASLFAVDLKDEDAVQARIDEIDGLVRGLDDTMPNLAAVETASTATVAIAPKQLRAALERKTFLAERTFLSLDVGVRDSRLDADEARRTLELEKEAAIARAKKAAEDAKRAEAERLRNLAEAEAAKTEALKALKSRLASVNGAKADLADRRQRLAERQEAQSKKNAEALKRVQDLLDRESAATNGPKAHALFGEIRAELRTSIDVLGSALSALEDRLVVPDLREGVEDVDPSASEEEKTAARELDGALEAFDEEVDELRRQQREFRLQSIGAAYQRVAALADARVRILAKVPLEVRRELEGLSRQGVEEARLEAELLALGARAQPIMNAEKIQRAPDYLKDVVALGKTFWTLCKIALVIFFGLWIRRRGKLISAWSDKTIRSKFRSVVWLRRYGFAKRNVQAYGRYLLFLLTIHLVYWSLGSFGETVLVDLLFTTVLWVSYYWLIRTWLDATILWLAKKRRVALEGELHVRLQRSTTLVARTVLIFGLLHSVLVSILRRGVLYKLASVLLIAAAVAVLLIVVRWWRRSIASAYLNKWSEGRLAELVQSTQDKFYNLFVVIAALSYVLGSGVAVFAQQFVLGFEQSRKALAFVFRKRLERRSEKLGEWGSQIDALPPQLIEAFTLAPLEAAALRVDHFPGLEKLTRDLSAWKERKSKGSFALIGGRGYGKTTWLRKALTDAADLDGGYLPLARKEPTKAALLEQLSHFLGIEASTYEAIVEHLNNGPKRLLAVDDAQHVFLRSMDGCEGLDTLMDLTEDTGRNVFWLCAFDNLSWRHIVAHRPTRIRFRAEHFLSDWPEEQLRELLMGRAASSGVTHEFEDLVVAGESDREQALVQAGEGYTRLIWDYSDGCPLVALRFWLHSLVPAGADRVRVRLFKEPDDAVFSNIPEESMFVYAAVANHGALTSFEASEVSGFPEPICESALIRGTEAGYLDEAGTRFALAVDWQRQMIRFLRSRQAL